MLQAGFAQKIISPDPREVFLDGFGTRLSPAEGVRDDLYVKACAVQNDGVRFVLLSIDVCGFNEEVRGIVMDHVTALNSLDESQIALCATHTHASLACGVLKDLPINYLVWHRVGLAAAYAARDALAGCADGYFAASVNGELRHIHNRRGRTDCDRRVKTLAFFDTQNNLRGVLASASCHPVIRRDMQISADYPGVLTRDGANRFPGVPFIFLQGRGADINPLIDPGVDLDSASETLGGEFRDLVFQAIAEARRLPSDRLSSVRKNVRIPMKDYPDAAALEEIIPPLRDEFYAEEDPVHKRIKMREYLWHADVSKQVRGGKKENHLSVPMQIAVLGGAVFAFLPFETLTPTGNAAEALLAREGFAEDEIFVVSCSNGVYGYLAPSAHVPQGGYEISGAAHWYGLPECCERSEAAVLDGVRVLSEGLAR